MNQRTIEEFVNNLEALKSEIQELYEQDSLPWVIGYSGGKDSTCVVQLIWYAIADLPTQKRTKKIWVVTNDTLVENPIVSLWVRKSLAKMQESAIAQGMPVETKLTTPEVKDTFWVLLIGKGYAAPRRNFRWCTDRLKIQPADNFIRTTTNLNGGTILVLGTRKAESASRGARMERYEQENRVQSRLNAEPGRPNSLTYLPIEDWRTDEVWMYLMQWQNPWGYSNKDLFTMYRGATDDNECPLVVDTTTPSCGSSRFGCWTCTVVNKDKSMEAMILNDTDKEWMEPLLDIRNELAIEDNHHQRDFRRLSGRVELFYQRDENGDEVLMNKRGPYLREWREYWLRQVLAAQSHARKYGPPEVHDLELITKPELAEIRRIWLEEKYEFDDSLPRIYEEATGQPYGIPRLADKALLDEDAWNALEESCAGDIHHFELMAGLLSVEQKHFSESRRPKVMKDLTACFDKSSMNEQESFKKAQHLHDVKTAIQATAEEPTNIHLVREAMSAPTVVAIKPNVPVGKKKKSKSPKTPAQIRKELESAPEPKQLSWANMKFSSKPEE